MLKSLQNTAADISEKELQWCMEVSPFRAKYKVEKL